MERLHVLFINHFIPGYIDFNQYKTYKQPLYYDDICKKRYTCNIIPLVCIQLGPPGNYAFISFTIL